jgi:hypothetical protein
MTSLPWRTCFVLSTICMGIGGPQHPDGTIPEMLADPIWFSAHAWVVASFVAMTAGLILFGRSAVLSQRVRWWLRIAVIVTAIQTADMVVHTAAYIDLANMLAGRATPVFTSHMLLTMIVYPIFGVLISAFIIVAARERALGNPWVAWIGVAGALAHGVAGFFTVAFDSEATRALFPLIMLVMVWALIVALMPERSTATIPSRA